jgi:hypothetical protein
MSKLNAPEAPLQGQTITVDFLFAYHRGDIAKAVGVSETDITKLFERPTHRIKTRTTKTNERPGGPLQGYDGPLNSSAFLPWAIQHARIRLAEKLFAQSQCELIQLAKAEYGLSVGDAWTFLRSVEGILNKFDGPLTPTMFLKWVRTITVGTPLHVKCFRHRNEVRRCLQHKLDPARYESNKGLTDTFQNRSTYAQNDLKIKLGRVIDDLESEVWRACAEETQAFIELPDSVLRDAVVKQAFRVADSWRDQAIRERKVSGGKNVEDLTGWKPASRGGSGYAGLEEGHDGDECSSWEPNSAGLQPAAPSHLKMADRLVIGYRIVNGEQCRDLSYGNPRSRDFIPAVGKKQEPLQAVETDEWVTAVLSDSPMKLADLKRKAKAEKNWGKDRITAAVKRLGLVKSGLWVRLPEWRSMRAA